MAGTLLGSAAALYVSLRSPKYLVHAWAHTHPCVAVLLYIARAHFELVVVLEVQHRSCDVSAVGRYEPEIAQFVKEHGVALGIPKRPCTPEQKKWGSIAAQRRKK